MVCPLLCVFDSIGVHMNIIAPAAPEGTEKENRKGKTKRELNLIKGRRKGGRGRFSENPRIIPAVVVPQ